jgi:hypothetical protein
MAMSRQEQQTMQFTILFSATARVCNLRFLLVVTVANLVCFVKLPVWAIVLGIPIKIWFPGYTVARPGGMVSCGVIAVHQVIGYV